MWPPLGRRWEVGRGRHSFGAQITAGWGEDGQVRLGEEELEGGEPVHAVDGEIGRVAGLRVDPGSHRVTHVLLQEGHLWGRKDVVIPASAVTKVEGGIWLNLTKEQVEALPPAD